MNFALRSRLEGRDGNPLRLWSGIGTDSGCAAQKFFIKNLILPIKKLFNQITQFTFIV
jgi:hypothetical protein